jgi:hypothetical protein
MPNWAYSKVTISGTYDTVSVIKHKLATPYPDPHSPSDSVEGVFLLWNIVKPDNLYTYLEKDKKAFAEIVEADPDLVELDKADKKETWDTGNIMAQILHQQATGQGWYEWNCRNWGTKWEIANRAILEYEMPIPITDFDDSDEPTEMLLEITYRLETAWSPPAEALAKLAEQYPDVTISLTSIDESDCFAMEAQWFRVPVSPYEWSQQIYEADLEITHKLGMDLRGYCNLECCNR